MSYELHPGDTKTTCHKIAKECTRQQESIIKPGTMDHSNQHCVSKHLHEIVRTFNPAHSVIVPRPKNS